MNALLIPVHNQSQNTSDANLNNIIQFPITKKIKTKTKPNMDSDHIPVQPIKDKQDIQRAKEYFLNPSNFRYSGLNIRNYCLFILGLNTGRRIGDILNLRICDIMDTNRSIKDKIIIYKEEKTGHKSTVFISTEVKEAISSYINSLDNDYNMSDFLFKTRQSDCMTTAMAWKIWNDMGKKLDIPHMGTHSGRKSKGYHYMEDHKGDYYALAKVSKAYGHSKQEITLDYLGMDDEEMKDFYLGNVL